MDGVVEVRGGGSFGRWDPPSQRGISVGGIARLIRRGNSQVDRADLALILFLSIQQSTR